MLEQVCCRPTLALGSALVHQKKKKKKEKKERKTTTTTKKKLRTTKSKRIAPKQKAKRAAGIEGQVATMLENRHNRHNNNETSLER